MIKLKLTEKQIEKLLSLTEYGEEAILCDPKSCYGMDYYWLGKSCFVFPDKYNSGNGYVEYYKNNKKVKKIINNLKQNYKK